MTQLPLSWTPPRDSQPRLNSQAMRMLDRLRQGRATNRELAAISLKYTSRLSDLRIAGYVIELVEHDFKSGLTVYELRG